MILSLLVFFCIACAVSIPTRQLHPQELNPASNSDRYQLISPQLSPTLDSHDAPQTTRSRKRATNPTDPHSLKQANQYIQEKSNKILVNGLKPALSKLYHQGHSETSVEVLDAAWKYQAIHDAHVAGHLAKTAEHGPVPSDEAIIPHLQAYDSRVENLVFVEGKKAPPPQGSYEERAALARETIPHLPLKMAGHSIKMLADGLEKPM